MLGRWSRCALIAVAVVLVCAAARFRVLGDDGHGWQGSVNGDGAGYHGMLVGLILHGNPADAPINPAFFTPAGDRHVIQYTCGAALMQAPFFLLAHGIALLRGSADGTGLGIEYQLGVVVAALSWALLGLWLIARVLARGGIQDGIIAFVIAAVSLGTGLLYYTVITPAMSHVYGFAAMAWSVFEAKSLWTRRSQSSQRLAIALAVMVLVRPTLGLVLLMLPAVALISAGTWQHALRAKPIILSIALGMAVLFIQPLLWKLQCGEWFVDGYAGEGFNWSNPRHWSVLFGARKGFFYYWPVMLLMLPALGWGLWRHARSAIPITVGLIASAYVISAWWNWYYGHGYGMRPLIDLMPVCALLIAAWLNALTRTMRIALMAASAPLIALQLFQTWQYQVGIIHPFNMDREKHALIFLRADDEAKHRFGDANVAELFAPNGMDTLASVSLSADSVIHLGPDRQHSPALRLGADRLPTGRELFADIELRRRALDPLASDTALLVFTYATEGRQRMHETFPMNDIRRLDDTRWRHWRHAFNMPVANPGEEVSIYLWQPGRGRVEVRDLRITVRAVRAQ